VKSGTTKMSTARMSLSQCNLNVGGKWPDRRLPYINGAPKYRLATFRLATFLGRTRGGSKASLTTPAQFLEHVDQRQCFRAGVRQQRFERFSPSAELWSGLDFMLVFKRCLARPQPLAATNISVGQNLPCGRGPVVGRSAFVAGFRHEPADSAPWQRQDKKKRPRIGGLSRDVLVRSRPVPHSPLNPKNGTVKS
jgi:hypothetical protein